MIWVVSLSTKNIRAQLSVSNDYIYSIRSLLFKKNLLENLFKLQCSTSKNKTEDAT